MPVAWGHSILEPNRGHVREPDTHVTDDAVVGFAICGAWLVADLPDDPTSLRCSICVALLADAPP